jgi:hypothetical protein
VLPGSDVPKSWSANNVVFTLIPQNFSGPSNPASQFLLVLTKNPPPPPPFFLLVSLAYCA